MCMSVIILEHIGMCMGVIILERIGMCMDVIIFRTYRNVYGCDQFRT